MLMREKIISTFEISVNVFDSKELQLIKHLYILKQTKNMCLNIWTANVVFCLRSNNILKHFWRSFYYGRAHARA